MDVKQLRYFARIVELESLTAAAQDLHVAQPSLSQHLANLESELGTKLLTRGAHGATPTAAGELLYRHARAILKQIQTAEIAIRSEALDPGGHVSLGLPTSTSQMLSATLIQELTARYKNLSLEIIEAPTADLARAVSKQRMDLAIAVDPKATSSMDVVPLLSEELLIVGRPGWTNTDTVRLEETAELPMVLPSFPNSVRAKMELACNAAGLQYRVIAESAAASVMLDVARAGIAWTILPWSALGERESTVSFASIAGLPLRRSLALCTSKAAASDLACSTVARTITEICRRKIERGEWKFAQLLGAEDTTHD